jgi:hypothetical protein
VIVINDNYLVAPWADILYACDLKWWDWHKGVPDFAGERWTQDADAARKYGLSYVRGKGGKGLSTDTGTIHTGSNSGYQAINLAYLFGARRVILTGYDMKVGPNGAAHWFGNHPDNIVSNHSGWLAGFKTIVDQRLVEVINCTRDTALTCFPQMSIEEAL